MKITYFVLCLSLLLISTFTCANIDLTSDQDHIDADPTPIQFRIALTPNGMTVSWSTVGPIPNAPTVRYGTNPLELDTVVSGETLHYDPSITWFHHVVLSNLKESTKYYWQVIPSDEKIVTPILDFMTAPPVGSDEPHRIAIYGDFGLGNSATTMTALAQLKDSIDLFWHIGDLAYADDYQDLNSTYEKVQEQWMNEMTDIWKNTPYMFLPGNHEATCNEGTPDICPEGQRNFTSYRLRYRMPYAEAGSPTQTFYSFDYGLVHYISLDTEVDYPGSPEGPGTPMNCGPFGDQLTWLRNDLEKAVANRQNVPWIFAGGHRPYYSSSGSSGIWPAAQTAFESILNDYKVDLVFWGHVHWTERMWPIAPGGKVAQDNYINAPNPIYIVSASVGNVEGITTGSDGAPYTAFLDQKNYGLGWLDVFNATTLRWQFISSDTLEVLDEAVIYKDPINAPQVASM